MIRLYQFHNLPARDLTKEEPMDFIDVDGYDLCQAVGCNSVACETDFTLLNSTYLQGVREYKEYLSRLSAQRFAN